MLKQQRKHRIIKIIQCQNPVCTLSEDELQFPTSNNKVFLRNNNFFIHSSQVVYVYDTKGNSQKLSEFQQFKKDTIFQQPYFVKFQFLRDDTYQMLSVDLRGNSQFFNIGISRTSTENKSFSIYFVSIMKFNKLYVSTNTVFVGIVLRKDEILIVFNKIAIFSVIFQFDCHAKKLFELKYFELNEVYQLYEDIQYLIFILQYMIYYYQTQKLQVAKKILNKLQLIQILHLVSIW